nr:glycoside hydrolase family 31 protein [Kineosphaera limosa]
MPDHLRLATRPGAHADNIVHAGPARITVLTPALIRLEYSPDGAFEDRASQVALFRDTEPAAFDVRRTARPDGREALVLDTAALRLTYDGGPFATHGLSVQVKGGVSNYHSTWGYGQPPEGNLGGTARTLDMVDGECALEPGILSRYGVAVLDDSASLLLTDDGWVAAREPGRVDVYVFAHGRDYAGALRDFYALTGPTPVLPRFALGNWWSRFHRYSADEYEGLMDAFAAQRLPFSVAVVDMDWHRVDIDPALGSGWTGFSWNRELFPDPRAFLRHLRERGLRTTLNIHPADGIRAHEDRYTAAALALGRDPSTGEPIAFDAADPDFLHAYLQAVLHPMEAEGVDFWWLDWQQGPFSALPGLDPLWMLNHVHYLDSAREGARVGRPMTFSRYAGPGSHRYPIGFSGDTVVSWASLAFQPRFTATASNIGYGWWSHDIGGHLFGVKDDELATRWVQLGVFSPILRLHSTSDAFNSKEPWRFGREAARVMGDYLRLRHRLVPYLHTMNRRAHTHGQPLVRPIYHEHPWADGAYEVPNQFAFGTQLLVAPITAPTDLELGMAAVDVWLPEGRWYDLPTGLSYAAARGGRRIRMHRTLDDLPLLARRGTILPLAGASDDEAVSVENPTHLQVLVVAGTPEGGVGEFDLLEDRDDDAWVRTPLRFDGRSLVIGPCEAERSAESEVDSEGEPVDPFAAIPAVREWEVVVLGAANVTGASVAVGGRMRRGHVRPAGRDGVAVSVGPVEPGQRALVTLDGDMNPAGNDVPGRVFDLLDQAQIAFEDKRRAHAALTRPDDPRSGLLELGALNLPEPIRAALTEIVLAQ